MLIYLFTNIYVLHKTKIIQKVIKKIGQYIKSGVKTWKTSPIFMMKTTQYVSKNAYCSKGTSNFTIFMLAQTHWHDKKVTDES